MRFRYFHRVTPGWRLRICAAAILAFKGVLGGRRNTQNKDSLYFERAKLVYDSLLTQTGSIAVYPSPMQIQRLKAHHADVHLLADSVGNRPNLQRLAANLRELARWTDLPAPSMEEIRRLVQYVRTAAADSSVLSQRLARSVGQAQAATQIRAALHTPHHLALLNLYQEF